MKNEYKTTSHAKHLLQYHIIFVCKYHYKILENDRIYTLIKHILIETAEKDKCKIHFL
jgi:REP element-mobilizing transposase RayT